VNPDTLPLAQIDTLRDEEVEEMLVNDAKLTEFVNRLPLVQDYTLRLQAVKRIQDEVDSLQARIAGNAELDATRRDVEAKRAEFQQKSAEKQAKHSELNPSSLFEKLDAKAKAADAECEDIAARFLAGEMSAQDFAKQYKEKRFYFHTLSAKKESILHNM